MADQEFQLSLEKLFAKNQTIPRLKEEFKIDGIEALMAANKIPLEFGLTLLAQMVLHKRADLPTMVGLLRPHAGDCSKTTCELLHTCVEANLVQWNHLRKEFILKWDVTNEVKLDLERFQYPLPMVCQPKEVKNNLQTGYYSIKGSIILKDNHHEDDVCLDHINAMNGIKLKIDFNTARMIQNKWRGLDKANPNESKEDYQKRVRAFEKYDRTAREVMEAINVAGNEFHLTHRYDKRGRVYSQGYHINYQGAPWNKAVIEFAHEEVTE